MDKKEQTNRVEINISKERCIRCGKCVKVCPAKLFMLDESSKEIAVEHLEDCIGCGHCVAACPENAVCHNLFPSERIHQVDYSQMPSAEQFMLLCKVRRSNRAFTKAPIPNEQLEMILEAAHRAPTGSNAQHVKFMLITDPKKLQMVSAFVMDLFAGMLGKLKNPFLKPLIKLTQPDALRYVPVFERMQEDYRNGKDRILRSASALILVYTPKGARMGEADANLAYQNGSLMAECLGVGHFYTGFVTNSVKMKKGYLEKMLGIDGEIHAGMALGMLAFRYPNYIDRKENDVTTCS